MHSISANFILQQENPFCQKKFEACHLRIKSALFLNDLKDKSGLTKNSK
jgi:hypothetical protein